MKTTAETATAIHMLSETNRIISADDKAEQANEINIFSIANIPFQTRAKNIGQKSRTPAQDSINLGQKCQSNRQLIYLAVFFI